MERAIFPSVLQPTPKLEETPSPTGKKKTESFKFFHLLLKVSERPCKLKSYDFSSGR